MFSIALDSQNSGEPFLYFCFRGPPGRDVPETVLAQTVSLFDVVFNGTWDGLWRVQVLVFSSTLSVTAAVIVNMVLNVHRNRKAY